MSNKIKSFTLVDKTFTLTTDSFIITIEFPVVPQECSEISFYRDDLSKYEGDEITDITFYDQSIVIHMSSCSLMFSKEGTKYEHQKIGH